MERSAKMFVVRYGSPESDDRNRQTHFPEAHVQCHLWCQTTEDLIRKKAKRGTHLEFYLSWVRSELERLREILRRLPALSKELDLHRNVVFTGPSQRRNAHDFSRDLSTLVDVATWRPRGLLSSEPEII